MDQCHEPRTLTVVVPALTRRRRSALKLHSLEQQNDPEIPSEVVDVFGPSFDVDDGARVGARMTFHTGAGALPRAPEHPRYRRCGQPGARRRCGPSSSSMRVIKTVITVQTPPLRPQPTRPQNRTDERFEHDPIQTLLRARSSAFPSFDGRRRSGRGPGKGADHGDRGREEGAVLAGRSLRSSRRTSSSVADAVTARSATWPRTSIWPRRPCGVGQTGRCRCRQAAGGAQRGAR